MRKVLLAALPIVAPCFAVACEEGAAAPPSLVDAAAPPPPYEAGTAPAPTPVLDAGDASDAADAQPPEGCKEIGATNISGADPSIFGEIAYFAGSADLPPGRYSLRYEDGCLKYGSGQDWTIHAYETQNKWYVGSASGDKLATPPGTIGYVTANGAYADFSACVAANKALAPVEFDFVGGKPLGVWLDDSPVSDNITGEGGRNPKWVLSRVDGCTP